MLLEAGRAREALAAFQKTMGKEPGRFLGLYGAGRAAEADGNTAAAAAFYRQLLAMVGQAPAERPSIARARQMAAAR